MIGSIVDKIRFLHADEDGEAIVIVDIHHSDFEAVKDEVEFAGYACGTAFLLLDGSYEDYTGPNLDDFKDVYRVTATGEVATYSIDGKVEYRIAV